MNADAWNEAARRREAAQTFLKRLRPCRRRSRESVLRVGKALRAVSATRLRDAWIEWATAARDGDGDGEGGGSGAFVPKPATLRRAWEKFQPRTNADHAKKADELVYLDSDGNDIRVPSIAIGLGEDDDGSGPSSPAEALMVVASVKAGDLVRTEMRRRHRSSCAWCKVCIVSIEEECIILGAPTDYRPPPDTKDYANHMARVLFELSPSELTGALVVRSTAGIPRMHRLPALSAEWGMAELARMVEEDRWWVSGPGVAASKMKTVSSTEARRLSHRKDWERVKDQKLRARTLLMNEISGERAHSKDTWLAVGKSLFSVGDDMLRDWIQWSLKGRGGEAATAVGHSPDVATFTEEDCKRAWLSFHPATSLTTEGMRKWREDLQGEVNPFDPQRALMVSLDRHTPSHSKDEPSDGRQQEATVSKSLPDFPLRKANATATTTTADPSFDERAASQKLFFLEKTTSEKILVVPAIRLVQRKVKSNLTSVGEWRMPEGLLDGKEFRCLRESSYLLEPGSIYGLLKSGDMIMLQMGKARWREKWLKVMGFDVMSCSVIVCDVWQRAYDKGDGNWKLPLGNLRRKNGNRHMQYTEPRTPRWAVGLRDLWGAWVFREGPTQFADGSSFEEHIEYVTNPVGMLFKIPLPDARSGIKLLETFAAEDRDRNLKGNGVVESHGPENSAKFLKLLDRSSTRLVLGWRCAGEAHVEVARVTQHLSSQTPWQEVYRGDASGCEVESLQACTQYRVRLWIGPMSSTPKGAARRSRQVVCCSFWTLPDQPAAAPLLWSWSSGGILPPEMVARLKLSAAPRGTRWEVECRLRPPTPPPFLLRYRNGRPEFVEMDGRAESAVRAWALSAGAHQEGESPHNEERRVEELMQWSVVYRGAQSECHLVSLRPGKEYEVRARLTLEDDASGPWSATTVLRAPLSLKMPQTSRTLASNLNSGSGTKKDGTKGGDRRRRSPPAKPNVELSNENGRKKENSVPLLPEDERAELMVSFAELMERFMHERAEQYYSSATSEEDESSDDDKEHSAGHESEDVEGSDVDPAAATANHGPRWRTAFDSVNRAMYYVNNSTGISQWTEPQSWQ